MQPAKVHPIRGDQKEPNPQPQENQPPAHTPATTVHPTEPEDKKATAASGAQQRKVLQMNVGKNGHAQGHPDAAAGQHATGSFTGDAEKENGKR